MSPLNALHLYRVRLRARFWQECFAILAIPGWLASSVPASLALQD
jgi:hypothetical protein